MVEKRTLPLRGRSFSKRNKIVSQKLKRKKKTEVHIKKLSDSHIGLQSKENHPLWGKHHKQESKEKMRLSHIGKHFVPEFRREQLRQKMINGYSAYIGSFVRNVSKPQTKLFDLVQRVCPYPIFNFPFYRKPRCYVIDIVVPKLELVIEYDEPYYHQDKDRDSKRQQEIEEEGWKFLRYESIPPLDQLKEDIKKVLNL